MERDSDGSGSDWEEPDQENGNFPSQCLFCTITCSSPEATFEHSSLAHGFDIVKFGKAISLDAIGYIKMINYIRKNNATMMDITQNQSKPPWLNDEYMKPVLQDDPLLMFDIEDYLEKLTNGMTDQMITITQKQYDTLNQQLVTTRRQLEQALEDMTKMKHTAQEILFGQATDWDNKVNQISILSEEEDDPYFSCYSHYGIHHEMLQDRVRTLAYRDAIMLNKDCFKDKIVLDVGCGTGILSMFAAASGAKRVYAVDQSEVIYQAMDIVRENDLDGVITLLKGRLEDIELPVKEVDIVMSEWMGYFLLFEGMLDTLLYARNRYLKPGGILLPDRCSISLVALADTEMHQKYIGFWDDVYGYHMSCMKGEVIKEANVEQVEGNKVCSHPVTVKNFDLTTCKIGESDFTSRFQIRFLRDCCVTAIVGYFTCLFERGLTSQVTLSTSPHSETTHWKQTIFLLPHTLQVTKGQVMEGKILCHRSRKEVRSLIVTLFLADITQSYSIC